MLKAFADEHVPLAIVRGLRVRGMDVTSVPETGFQGTDDDMARPKKNATLILVDSGSLAYTLSHERRNAFVGRASWASCPGSFGRAAA